MNKKLKVLQVIGSPDPGGAQTFYLRLVQALRDECTVVPVVRTGSWMEAEIKALGLPYHSAPFGGKLDIFTKRALKKIIQAETPDVMMAWMNRANTFMPSTSIPVVGRMGGYYDLKYYTNTDYIVGNTHDICDFVKEKGFAPQRVQYIPNFTVTPDKAFEQRRAAIREKYRIPKDATAMLIAGRLHDVKAVDVAIDAMKDLPNNVYVLVAGVGKNEEALRRQAAEAGLSERVCFTGWVSDVTPLAAASDIWLAPSRFEPLGNTILDAWAHKLPIISTDTDGPLSLITSEEDGLIVPKNDAPALAEAIKLVMSDKKLAGKLIAGGTKTLAKSYSQQAVLARYMDFYRAISMPRGQISHKTSTPEKSTPHTYH